MRILPASELGGIIYKHIPPLWCAGIFLNLNPSLGDNSHDPDSLAFLLIVLLAANQKTRGLKIPMILKTIAKDAMRYFLVIFSAHFAFEMTLNFGRVSATCTLYGLLSNSSDFPLLGNDPTPSGRVSHLRSTLNAITLNVSSLLQPAVSSCKCHIGPQSSHETYDCWSQVSSRYDFTDNALVEEGR